MIKLDAYKDQVVGVFGLGKAGQATVQALAAGGAKVVAWDDNEAGRKAVDAMDLDVRFHKISKWPWDHLTLIVLSPGIPLNYPQPHDVVKLARQHCLPIIGDVELLYQAMPHATYVAITGTNGKSTTTSLIGHILKQAGKCVEVGGNIGTAALSLEPLAENGIYVLELSSYQLDLLATTRFDISLLLNLSPDHIERHGSLAGYMAAKMHIFDRQTQHDHAVVAVDDAYTRAAIDDLQYYPVGLSRVTVTNEIAEYLVSDGVLMDENVGVHLDLKEVRNLQGRHNWQNAVAAYTVAKLIGVDPKTIEAGLKTFPGLEHRMEWVSEMDGIAFINDSKATNADAASHALSSFDNVYWILGGVAKEGGIDVLEEYFPKVKRAYLIGEAANEFADVLGGEVMHSECETMDQAVAKAFEDAKQAGLDSSVILLSPACASFDQYDNFEQRGDHFKRLVEGLANEK